MISNLQESRWVRNPLGGVPYSRLTSTTDGGMGPLITPGTKIYIIAGGRMASLPNGSAVFTDVFGGTPDTFTSDILPHNGAIKLS